MSSELITEGVQVNYSQFTNTTWLGNPLNIIHKIDVAQAVKYYVGAYTEAMFQLALFALILSLLYMVFHRHIKDYFERHGLSMNIYYETLFASLAIINLFLVAYTAMVCYA